MSLKSKDNDFVSEDRNWRSLILNELNCAQQWQEDWGFLSSGEGLVNDTLEEKIRKMEEKVKRMSDQPLRTTASAYGSGESLEKFRETRHNVSKNPELLPCDRKMKKK